MKKKIIMIGIILISTTSLLLVMFYMKTKNIKYISSNEIESYSNISMTLDGVQITNTQDLNSGYYKINTEDTTCTGGSVSWSNISHKLKVKVTTNPLKCTIALSQIRTDVNVVAVYVNGVEQADNFTFAANTYYYMQSTSSCANGATLSFQSYDIMSKTYVNKLTLNNYNGGKEYCTARFITKGSGESIPVFLEKMIIDKDATITSGTYSNILNEIYNTQAIEKLIVNRQALEYLATPAPLAEMKANPHYGIADYNTPHTFLSRQEVGQMAITMEEAHAATFAVHLFNEIMNSSIHNSLIDGIFWRFTDPASAIGSFDSLNNNPLILSVNGGPTGSNTSLFARNAILFVGYKVIALEYMANNTDNGAKICISGTTYDDYYAFTYGLSTCGGVFSSTVVNGVIANQYDNITAATSNDAVYIKISVHASASSTNLYYFHKIYII